MRSWEAGRKTGLWDGPQGPAGRARRTQAKPSAAAPVTPTAAAAWPASGLGSGPGCSLSCTGSSSGRGPGPPASGGGMVGGCAPSPSTAPEIQSRLGVAQAALREPAPSAAAGPGLAGAPATTAPRPAWYAGPGTKTPAFRVCPTGTPAGSCLCRPSWAGNTLIAQAVSSLSPAWGTSCWQHHMIHHRAACARGPAAPALLSTCGLPGSTCDLLGSGTVLGAPASGTDRPQPSSPGGATLPKDQSVG